jgi:hypothetical protein
MLVTSAFLLLQARTAQEAPLKSPAIVHVPWNAAWTALISSRNFDSEDARGSARLNDAYITLLPKKEGAISVGDFRPVSLIHNIAKIVSKAMAMRLVDPISQLVDSN